MADRTSADLFGRIFKLLATDLDNFQRRTERQYLAQEVFNMTYEFDFSTYQMDADAALDALDVETDEEPKEEDEDFGYFGCKVVEQ